MYAGGVLGSPPKQYDIVTKGVADISWTVLGYIGGQFPLSSVIELPFLTRTSAAGSTALNTLYDEGYLDKEMSGIHLIGLHSNPGYQIHMKNTKVMDPSDFKGKKMRVPSKIAGTILKTLGATGVKVPAPGTYEALNKGVLDGTPFPYTAVGSFKLFEVTKYHTEVNITNATFGLIMNKDKYKSLDSVQKKCIDKFSGHAFSGWASNLIDRQNEKMKEVVANTPGHEIAVASPAVIAKYKKILKPIEKDWLAEMKGKGLDGAGVLKRADKSLRK
jgi:TRAP-type C4-dicarboxylate transport system, periplasmic component